MTNIPEIVLSSNNKRLRSLWLRKSAGFMELIGKREKDLSYLKQNKAKQSTIDLVDFEITTMVEFYNHTEKIIDSFLLESVVLKSKIILLNTEMIELQKLLNVLIDDDIDQTEKLLKIIHKINHINGN